MPGRYLIEPAVPEDDAGLRALFRATAMDGPLRLSFQREPGFFTAAEIGNLATSVMVCRETANGQVAATATRAIRRAYVDENETAVGYLSSLRIRDDSRGATLLARFYQRLRQMHTDGRVPYYVSTILDGNENARRLLTSERAGLPHYAPAGRLHTYMVPLYGWRLRTASRRVVRGATAETLPAALSCLNRFNAGFQFAPVYRAEDFGVNSRILPGLSEHDLYLYFSGREVAGTMAVWDQNRFKQSVVAGYSTWMSALRPILTLGAKLGLAPRLPRRGQTLPYLYAAMISSQDTDPDVFRELLDTILRERANTGYAYLLLGLCDRHPLRGVVERRSVMTIKSQIYIVYWRDRAPDRLPSADHVPHLEIATL